MTLIYQYSTLYPGILLKRYKRFLADIELTSGEIVTAHCANTGSMTGVCFPGYPVQLSYTNNPNRKLPYSLEMIQVNNTWVGVNTALPNQVIKLALEKRLFPQLGDYEKVRSEVVYGKDKKSRVDFMLTGGKFPIYLEVKNTTWMQDNNIALFPDSETTRGQKHLQELMDIMPECRAVMLYFINRGDCTEFSPGDDADPIYGKMLRQAVNLGLEVLPCRFNITPTDVTYLGLADLRLG